MVNAVGFPYIESSKLCLMVEAKIMTLSDGIFQCIYIYAYDYYNVQWGGCSVPIFNLKW